MNSKKYLKHIIKYDNITLFKEFNNFVELSKILEEDVLMYAAINNSSEIIKYLLTSGYDYNITDKNNNTILHWLCFKRNFDLIKFIIENNYYRDINYKNKFCVTPLVDFIDSEDDNLKIFKYLIENGADYDVIYDGRTILELIEAIDLPNIEQYLTNLLDADKRRKSIQDFLEK